MRLMDREKGRQERQESQERSWLEAVEVVGVEKM